MTVKEFKKKAESSKYKTPDHFDYEDLERKYWKNISFNLPIYGADVSGSLTDPAVEEWNINKLGSILDFVNEDYNISIDGVNTAYLSSGCGRYILRCKVSNKIIIKISFRIQLSVNDRRLIRVRIKSLSGGG